MKSSRVVVTGSSGHLGEALVRTLRTKDYDVVGLDLLASEFTTNVGSLTDREVLREALFGADTVLHTAALQKPHLVSHPWPAFVESNVTGTLLLLEEARSAGVRAFVFTSSTSAFGKALSRSDSDEATWITEDVAPVPKNIYGVTKVAAEDLCELAACELGLPVVVLRTGRFFPEPDDDERVRARYSNDNVKANEFLHRRVDLADVVDVHLRAMAAAPSLGFARFVISATTPFCRDDARLLAIDMPSVVARHFPDQPAEYERRSWTMFPRVDRVCDNTAARHALGWMPRYDFRFVLDQLIAIAIPGAHWRAP